MNTNTTAALRDLTENADLAFAWLNSAMNDRTLRDAMLDHLPNNFSRAMLQQSIAQALQVLEGQD